LRFQRIGASEGNGEGSTSSSDAIHGLPVVGDDHSKATHSQVKLQLGGWGFCLPYFDIYTSPPQSDVYLCHLAQNLHRYLFFFLHHRWSSIFWANAM
jgi:hypothetical protein